MTATEELRCMLDERGIDWDYGITGAHTTKFAVNGVDLTFTPMRGGLVCSTILTPEQVIAVTLGERENATPTNPHSKGEGVRQMASLVELPTDVDGITILPGDKVEILHNHHVRTVAWLEYVGSEEMTWRMWANEGGGGWGDYTPCRHVDQQDERTDKGLKSCPFCGGEATYCHVDGIRHPWSRIVIDAMAITVCCTECGASIPSAMTQELVTDAWNRRAQ